MRVPSRGVLRFRGHPRATTSMLTSTPARPLRSRLLSRCAPYRPTVFPTLTRPQNIAKSLRLVTEMPTVVRQSRKAYPVGFSGRSPPMSWNLGTFLPFPPPPTGRCYALIILPLVRSFTKTPAPLRLQSQPTMSYPHL